MAILSNGALGAPDPAAGTGGPGQAGKASPPAEPSKVPDAPATRPEGTPAPDFIDPELLGRIAQQLVRLHTDVRDTRTVQEVIDTYLSNVGNEINNRTLELRQRTLKLFGQHFGKMPVAQCTPIQLREWIAERKNWASGWSKMRVHADIQRIFNAAANLRFIRENPFRGLRLDRGQRKIGREMYAEEFQAILRATDPAFRRLLITLKMTGARPSELSALQWCQVDWEKGLGVLEHHKTARKTGKPRVIVFPPPVMKLLAWIYRHRKGRAAVELQRILQASSDRRLGIREVAKQMMAKGFTYRQIYGARRLIGAKFERVGGWGSRGRTVYCLPTHPLEERAPHEDYVFLCGKKRPWVRTALGTKFKRLRKELGLPMSCKLYGLRHSFITDGVRRNVNIKALATLVGHVDTRMIETTYCHVGQDFAFLRTAALQALGQAALSDQVVKQPQPAAANDGKPTSEAPASGGTEAADSVQGLVHLLLRQIQTLEERLKAAESKPVAPTERKLQPSEQLAYDAANWAIAQNPELARATDEQIYAWLRTRPEYEGQLPPTAVSFKRYLHHARRLLDGCGKRERRRKGWTPPDPNGQAEKGEEP